MVETGLSPKKEQMMARDSLIEEIHDRKDVRRTFEEIRGALGKATSQEDLAELYKQAVYMILMTHSSPLNEKNNEMKQRRESTEQEFTGTVHLINERAKELGLQAGYSEDWEKISTNGYETEGENLLEAPSDAGVVEE
jgi:hypothetical protein